MMLHRTFCHQGYSFPELSRRQPCAFDSALRHRLVELPFIDDALSVLRCPGSKGAIEGAGCYPG